MAHKFAPWLKKPGMNIESHYDEASAYGILGPRAVVILSGSASDKDMVGAGTEILRALGVGFEYHALSAHRNQLELGEFADNLLLEQKTYVLMGVAGMAAALPGDLGGKVIKFQQTSEGDVMVPQVYGIPGNSKDSCAFNDMAAVASISALPPGPAVSMFGLGKPGMINASMAAVNLLDMVLHVKRQNGK
ncbi:MAG: AIR carboxylase family protein [Rickettsiales bacterium]|jgi:phosphoribosylcarboxyaminoimidazole (NCAIR) mutase|nr:AIR carboxylase family protein [Rickettsiales bacterium]